MKIVVYGNSDKDEITGFSSEEKFIIYIRENIFKDYNGRYQYSQSRDADIIILSREGKAYGYFEISGTENPTIEDTTIAKNPRKVYLVSKSTLFNNPVRLNDIGIAGYQFGKSVTEEQFEKIKNLGGVST